MDNKYILIIILVFLFFIYLKKENIEYKYGIVLCCYNRYDYLKQTFDSLSKSNLNNCILCIVDDFSKDKNVIDLIDKFYLNNVKIHKIRNKKNVGISLSLYKGFNYIYPKCEYMINIDSDVIMKKNWLQILNKTYDDFINNFKSNNVIVTGFNCVKSCNHKIIKEYETFYIKKSFGGINLFFDRNLFYIFKDILKNKGNRWDWGLVEYCNKNNIKMISTKPSVIQHIGIDGMNSRNKIYDYAEDF